MARSRGRDADRTVAAARKAGLAKIDFVLLTHYHVDHAGGVPSFSPRFPLARSSITARTASRAIGRQSRVGGLPEAGVKPACDTNYRESGRHPAYRGLRAEIVSSDGTLIQKPLPGAGAHNAACSAADNRPRTGRKTLARSYDHHLRQGRILDLGDLTRNKEGELVCPSTS